MKGFVQSFDVFVIKLTYKYVQFRINVHFPYFCYEYKFVVIQVISRFGEWNDKRIFTVHPNISLLVQKKRVVFKTTIAT